MSNILAKTSLQEWGNSLAIRIPKKIKDTLHKSINTRTGPIKIKSYFLNTYISINSQQTFVFLSEFNSINLKKKFIK